MNHTLEILKAGRALIADPKNWIQGNYARDKDGLSVDQTSPNAVCFCSVGAMDRALFDLKLRFSNYQLARIALAAAFGDSVVRSNDSRSHEEVIAGWDRAIETEESKA